MTYLERLKARGERAAYGYMLELKGEGALEERLRIAQFYSAGYASLAEITAKLAEALERIADIGSALHPGRDVSFRDWELRQIAKQALAAFEAYLDGEGKVDDNRSDID